MTPRPIRPHAREGLVRFGSAAVAAAVWLLVGASPLAALPVSEAQARIVARNTIRQHIAVFGAWGGVLNPRIEAVETIEVGPDRLAYNVRIRPSGHLLLAADDEFSPVLLYSDTHAFDVSRADDPEAFESWIVTETSNVWRRLQQLAQGRPPGSRPDRWQESPQGRAWGRFGVPEESVRSSRQAATGHAVPAGRGSLVCRDRGRR